jgi:hypothetical protein
MPKDLAETLQDAIPEATRLRTAVVRATGGSGRAITVNLDGTDLNVPRLLGWTPYVGDIVLLVGSNGFWYALGSLSAQQSAPPVVVPPIPVVPPSGGSSGTASFQAIDSGSWRNGGWRGDTANVIQGDWTSNGINSGLWFYGDSIKATLAGKIVSGARLYVPRISGGVFGAQTATIARHDRATKAGNPSWWGVAGSISLAVNTQGWAPLEASQIQALVTDGGGLGLQANSPYFVANSISGDRQSGTLQIDWRTN